jgi:hypothetical protein
MAPEQALSPETIDHRVDIYALGVVLYEMLTGANPFRAETPLKTLLRHSEGPRPPQPSAFSKVPAAVDALTAQLLAIDPQARPRAAHDVAASIERALEDESAPPAALPAPTAPPARTRRAAPRGGVALGVAVLLGVALVAISARTDRATPADDAGTDARADPAPRADAGPHSAGGGDTVVPAAVNTVVDAAVDAGVDAGASAPSRSGDAPPDRGRPRMRVDASTPVLAPQPPTDASAPPLLRKLDFLERSCAARVTCASGLRARYEAAMKNDLAALKSVRADVDACVAACATAQGQPDQGQ